MSERVTGVLFVCLGNICRSPLAEGVFLHLARARQAENRFRVASAGTGSWHIGSPPDPRSQSVARAHGISLVSRAQQVSPEEHFNPPQGFDWFVGMDADNCAQLIDLGAPRRRVVLLRSFDQELHGEPEHRLYVPDPYYGGEDGFDQVYRMVHAGCAGLLERLLSGKMPE